MLHKQKWPPPSSSSLSTPSRHAVTGHPEGTVSGMQGHVYFWGPKPDNLTVIHSKLIKHLQMCHDGGRAPFISSPPSPTHRPTSLRLRRLNLTMQMRQRRAGWAGGLTLRLVHQNYKQITHPLWAEQRVSEGARSEGCVETLLLLDDYSRSRKWQCCQGELAAYVKLLL